MRWTIFDKAIAEMRYKKVKMLIKPQSIVCDIGCGFNGAFLCLMSDNIIKGIGFDRKVSNTNYKNINLFQINDLGQGILLENNSVDYVTMIALLEHLSDPVSVIQEVSRILKSDGKLILTTPTKKAKHVLEFLAFKLNIISCEEIEDHKHYYSQEDILNILHDNGFKDVKIHKFQIGYNQLAVATRK